jgi:F-type H+-transporting ATPase subunit b
MATLATLSVLAAVERDPQFQLLPDEAELIWGAVAFFTLLAIMWKTVFPKIGQVLDERAARIQGQMEEAEALRVEAEQLRRQYQEQLAGARAEADQILEDARQQADRSRADALARADQEAAALLARAREDAEAERGRLVQDLRDQVANLSVELAGRIVQRELDPDRHRELVDQYITELSGLN